MERITWVLLALCLGNLLLWCFPESDTPTESPEKLVQEIATLEKETTVMAHAAEWMKRAKAMMNSGASENLPGFLNRLQALAKVCKFTIQETAQTGDTPVYIRLSGDGWYRGAGQLIGEIARNPNVVVQKISMLVQDTRLVQTRLEMAVKTGPWKSAQPLPGRIDPLPEKAFSLSIGHVDLFGGEIVAEKAVMGAPKIRYLGFYSGKGNPTGIIEESLKALLVKPGDSTPSGLHVQSITPEFLEVRADSERGKVWKIPLEKSR